MTGVFDKDGREFRTDQDVRAAMDFARQVNVVIEFTTADGTRVTTAAHPFAPEIAAMITGVRILPPGSE